MKKILYELSFISLLCFLSASCAKEELNNNEPVDSFSNNYAYLSDFAKILSKAVTNEPELRSFIKTNALSMYDRDYDVFYPYVKDRAVGNGQSFRDILLKYDSESRLSRIEEEEPLLNILVPDWSWVDDGCFSIKTWAPSKKEIIVACPTNGTKVPLWNNGRYVGLIKGNEFLSEPVLIVKRNERMVFSKTKAGDSAYCFLDPVFDGSITTDTKGRWYEHTYEFETRQPDNYVLYYDFPDKVKQAYYESQNAYSMPQRDHIYYGMTSSNDHGQVDSHYKERLFKFRFHTGYVSALSDDTTPGNNDEDWFYAGNPGACFSEEQLTSLCWTTGAPELAFHIITGTEDLPKIVAVPTSSAFSVSKVHFQWYQNFFGAVTYRKYWVNPDELVPKWIMADWDLFTWNLKDLPKKYKVTVEEIDTGTQTTQTDSSTYRFATNISTTIESNAVINTKIGFGYGITEETTRQSSVSYTSYSNNDNLGSAWVEYTDPIITNIPNPVCGIYCYTTGIVDFMIIPSQTY